MAFVSQMKYLAQRKIKHRKRSMAHVHKLSLFLESADTKRKFLQNFI